MVLPVHISLDHSSLRRVPQSPRKEYFSRFLVQDLYVMDVIPLTQPTATVSVVKESHQKSVLRRRCLS